MKLFDGIAMDSLDGVGDLNNVVQGVQKGCSMRLSKLVFQQTPVQTDRQRTSSFDCWLARVQTRLPLVQQIEILDQNEVDSFHLPLKIIVNKVMEIILRGLLLLGPVSLPLYRREPLVCFQGCSRLEGHFLLLGLDHYDVLILYRELGDLMECYDPLGTVLSPMTLLPENLSLC